MSLVGSLLDSLLGFSFGTGYGEGLLVPLAGGKHVGAVVDTDDIHLFCVLKVLQELKINMTKHESWKHSHTQRYNDKFKQVYHLKPAITVFFFFSFL